MWPQACPGHGCRACFGGLSGRRLRGIAVHGETGPVLIDPALWSRDPGNYPRPSLSMVDCPETVSADTAQRTSASGFIGSVIAAGSAGMEELFGGLYYWR